MFGRMLLSDKVALVTGGAEGIGEAVARLFASEGAKVFLLDVNRELVSATASSISSEGGFAQAFGADVRDREGLSAVIGEAILQFGRIDILINNAGIYPRRAFLDITEQDWTEMLDVNLKGTFYCAQLVAPHMISQRAGKIVNISSVTFHLGTPNMSHYVASKGGMIGLTRSIAREMGEHNVHVNCITPGAIKTESEKRFVTPEQAQAMVDQQSLKRRLMPLDIARVCLFLSSELSDGLTGQILNVDGGWYLH